MLPASPLMASFPHARPRRLRQAPWIRAMVSENSLSPADFIWPCFVMEGRDETVAVESMPGVHRYTVDRLVAAAGEAAALGVPCIAIFPETPERLKTPGAEEAWNPDNLVNTATRAVKDAHPDLGIMLDVALDPYNSDGHDGIVENGKILNDPSLEALERQTLAQAAAGADVMGPSDMMDGRVGVMRTALEREGHPDVTIMSYAAKYASAFYGPFRDAVGSGGALKGDKKTYQMDPANGDEALREVAMDLAEGADMVMVKPGMPYLDICRRVHEAFNVPVFAYQVSGEYAMLRHAMAAGALDEERGMMESLMAFRRAGCSGVLTYFALDAARVLQR
ncbi:MAG: porphobilinogen synthase [Pseudomonadota bacterium]